MTRTTLILAAALGASCLLMAQARAGGVYRCVVDGVPTFTSKAVKGQSCKALTHAPGPPRNPHMPKVGASNLPNTFKPGSAPPLPPPSSMPGGLPPLPPMSLPES